MIERRPKYTLRKLSVGLASIMMGSVLFLTNPPEAHAETGNSDPATTESSSVDEKSTSINNQKDTNKDNTNVEEPTKVESSENVTSDQASESNTTTQDIANTTVETKKSNLIIL
ncbi:YSIRK-type signal peptide-containing protein [Lactobacillus gigeriorum]|uniref:YSIRK Gram-positive signal peptide domain-containing protein n=1 Tax=Lactobacillus gigeriorum DSM 23908 = CRBIP 24.85 TaxID=1423751 RepID=I7LFW9_9LACO|nr:YSIRK-type signal peptide-containing protein [Lactobacillus gigeriorum]KRN10571.1 hypothetical protein FC38_GL000969 [Lactobacillus gigeriorum DSM 23908 = CRBIP 24.85]CCI87043.1 Protein of unknown function [Lactobacillus gigeriorum DSM 23908 = CRBIP 24.85]